jgi:hypothetical protein
MLDCLAIGFFIFAICATILYVLLSVLDQIKQKWSK